MRPAALPVHVGLAEDARFRFVSDPRAEPSALEWTILAAAGVGAACAVVLLNGWKLGIPGHAILRATLPMMAGLALVPRRGSGSIMGFATCATGLGLFAGGASNFPVPALVAATLFGPALDVALEERRRLHPYLAAVLAGIAANLLGLGAKSITAWMGISSFDGRLMYSIATYTLCGAIAGAVGAAMCFRASQTKSRGA